MTSTFCGYLSDMPESLEHWCGSLQSNRYTPVSWRRGNESITPARASFFLSRCMPETRLWLRSESALAVMIGAPYRLAENPALPRSTIDLARIVEMVSKEGPAALGKVGGSFAIAVSFPDRGELLLAVDRFSIENLFYALTAHGISYATRALDLFKHPSVTGEITPQSAYDYLYFHCIPGPETGFQGMKRLLPGHYLHLVDGQHRIRPFWAPRYVEDRQTPLSELSAKLPAIIDAAVVQRLPDTKTACFLSGGLDSSTLTGLCAKRRPGDVTAFTIGFDAPGYDEVKFAESAAKHFKVKHECYYVKPRDIVEALPRIVDAMDAPFGNASAVPTYFCARLAAEHGFTSIMAGDGGDELFGGNSRYTTQLLFEAYSYLPEKFRRWIVEPLADGVPVWARRGIPGKAISYVQQARIPLPDRLMTYNLLNRVQPESFLTEEFLGQIDRQRPMSLFRDMYDISPDTAVANKLMHLEWRSVLADSDLPKVSRTCALAGIAVSFPMLDEQVFEFASTLPSRAKVSRHTLRPLFRDAFRAFLPQATLNKSKQGFGLPFGVWLQESSELKDFANTYLLVLESRGILKPGFRDKFLSGTLNTHPAYFGVLAWILMVLGIWFRNRETNF